MYCVDFAENALFSSLGVICLQPLPSMLSDETLMDNKWAYYIQDTKCVLSAIAPTKLLLTNRQLSIN